MSCKTLSLSAFNITCFLLICVIVIARPVLSARKLAFQGPDKVKVNGHPSPKGPAASVDKQNPGFPSPFQSSPLGSGSQSSSTSSNSNYSRKCTSEKSCVNGNCTIVNDCESTSSQQHCVNGNCYSTP